MSVLTIFVVGDALEPGRFCERAPLIQRKAIFREQQIVDVPANPTRPDESKPADRTFRECTRNGFSTANAVSRVRYSAQKHAMRPQHPSTFRNNRSWVSNVFEHARRDHCVVRRRATRQGAPIPVEEDPLDVRRVARLTRDLQHCCRCFGSYDLVSGCCQTAREVARTAAEVEHVGGWWHERFERFCESRETLLEWRARRIPRRPILGEFVEQAPHLLHMGGHNRDRAN